MDKKNDKNQKVENIDEIDDFAKALLNKKTEMVLFPEDEDMTSQSLDRSQRQAAEESMSTALDLLRKERGQMSIEEEEEAYVYDQHKELFDPANVETKGTFEALFESMDKEEQEKEKAKEKAKEQKAKEQKAKQQKEKAEPKKEKTKPVSTKEVQKQKRVKMTIIGCIALVLLLLGGYTYKVSVYDPAHIVTEQQQKSYDALVAYADEWDMLSETEKLEIIDLEDDYKSLVDSQKEKINAYFVDQTDQKFSSLLNEMKKLSKDQKDEKNPEYNAIMEYMVGWSNKGDTEKRRILNYQESFDNLSEYLKGKINDRCVEETGSTFKGLCKDQNEIQNAEIEKRKEQEKIEKENRKIELRNQINNLNVELNELQIYQQSLEAEGAEDDVKATNLQAIQLLEAQIRSLESQIAALGE